MDHGALKEEEGKKGDIGNMGAKGNTGITGNSGAMGFTGSKREKKARWEQREARVSLGTLVPGVQKDLKEKMASEERDKKEMQQT